LEFLACRIGHRSEDGVVESALVIIPLTVLFLLSLQLMVAVNYRNIDKAVAQGQASSKAIKAVTSSEDEIVLLRALNGGKDLRVMVTHKSRNLPGFLTSLSAFADGFGRSTDVVGVAVMEDSD